MMSIFIDSEKTNFIQLFLTSSNMMSIFIDSEKTNFIQLWKLWYDSKSQSTEVEEEMPLTIF